MKMYEHVMTIGLFDKDLETQIISTDSAREYIQNTLIDGFGVYAFTMIDCSGVYRMESTGAIVREPSIRVEIAADAMIDRETAYRMISALKKGLNQESIMYKVVSSDIEFI